MEHFYIPYNGGAPAVLNINGHRLVVLAFDESTLDDHMDLLGAEHIHHITEDDFDSAEEMLRGLAEASDAEIVITPPEIELDHFIEGLRQVLPWPH